MHFAGFLLSARLMPRCPRYVNRFLSGRVRGTPREANYPANTLYKPLFPGYNRPKYPFPAGSM